MSGGLLDFFGIHGCQVINLDFKNENRQSTNSGQKVYPPLDLIRILTKSEKFLKF